MYQVVKTLPQEVALDIVGDIHGEYESLQALVQILGYDENGSHPQNRKLVFVGDLCDRGPNTPAVIAWVANAVSKNNAYAVLGNHECNLLSHDVKDGSGWYFKKQFEEDIARYGSDISRVDDEITRLEIYNFLKSLPFVLIRDDLRIVHAAWMPKAIAEIQQQKYQDAAEAFNHDLRRIHLAIQDQIWFDDYRHEKLEFDKVKKNEQQRPDYFRAIGQYGLFCTNFSPFQQLTSGPGALIGPDKIFYAGGKWRYVERAKWWENYQEEIPVIIGHYWRKWKSTENKLFTDISESEWFGAKKNVFCIDYSIGAKWRERHNDSSHGPHRLAALRWPEKTLQFADGESAKTSGFLG